MKEDEMFALVEEMKACNACHMRSGCQQVVPPVGAFSNPILLIVAEAPGQSEDECGEPLCGPAGQLLREVLRGTKILNRSNTVLSNVMKCRPPKNKFPKDDCPTLCFGKWLAKEIDILKPERMLLLGNVPLEYVANMDGITRARGNWLLARGVRSMPTFHPSYILRTDRDGMHFHRDTFESDIAEVAREVASIEEKRNAGIA